MRFRDFYTLDESLYANERKLMKLLSMALGEDAGRYIAHDAHSMKELVHIRPKLLDKVTEDELKAICKAAGYYCSIHYNDAGKPLKFDPIIVTPINQKDPVRLGDQEYYHCSLVKNLDTKGIRLRSRTVDNEFDIYEDRIYLCPVALCSAVEDLVEMVADEHKCGKEDITVYKVTLPRGYPVYQDPTEGRAVYVTNAIPAKYVKKLNIETE